MDQVATIVLLVDPDARHRATATRLLKSLGCSVVAVRNGAEAIETFEAHHADIALIIADAELVRPLVRAADASAAWAGADTPARRTSDAHTWADEHDDRIPARAAARVLFEQGMDRDATEATTRRLFGAFKQINARVPIILMADATRLANARLFSRRFGLPDVWLKPLDELEARAVLRVALPSLAQTAVGAEPRSRTHEARDVVSTDSAATSGRADTPSAVRTSTSPRAHAAATIDPGPRPVVVGA